MDKTKDTPTVIEDFERLHQVASYRLDRLERNTELILRSIAQVGLVSNSTIAQIDGELNPTPATKINNYLTKIDKPIITGLMICWGVVIMVVSSFVADLLLSIWVRYLS